MVWRPASAELRFLRREQKAGEEAGEEWGIVKTVIGGHAGERAAGGKGAEGMGMRLEVW